MRRTSAAALICAAALACAIPAAADASVQVGSSGWQWGNPLPQGNTLAAMSFAGPSGYAAGSFGTLLATADAGATWSGLLAGTYTDLTEVQAIDADSVFAGGGCVARRSDDGGRTFKRVAFTPSEARCTEPLAAGWFVGERTGYVALADGTVLRTDDDGDTFSQRTPLPGTRVPGGRAQPADLVFTTPEAGVGATSDGRIFRTTDGANSWTEVSSTDRAVREIVFLDAQEGFAVGQGSLLLHTTDAGATWRPRALAGVPGSTLTSIRCATSTLCVMTTESGAQLVRTEDGGDTASLVTPSLDAIHAAAFASTARIVAGGAQGSTAVSDDAGRNFHPVGGRLTGTFSRIRAGLAPGTAFAPGANGALARTTDGGRTWLKGNVSTSEDVLDASFPTATTGFALDASGGLFRTADGGATWRSLDTGSTARPAAIFAPSATTVLVVGPTGVRRSTDAGETFAAVRGKAVSRARVGAVDRAGSAIVVSGPQALLRSTDRGKSWTALPRPGRQKGRRGGPALQFADFTDARTGYALAGGTLYRTTDAGRRWTALRAVGADGVYGMSFSSPRNGYLLIDHFGQVPGSAGFLLRTTDAGATWQPQFVVSTPIAAGGLAAAPGGTDYLLGGASSLLFSTTGGAAGRPSTLSVRTARARLRRPGRITVTGRLSPAAGRESVTVSRLAAVRGGSLRWQHQTVAVAANGAYTTSWDLGRGTSRFVAQWSGDFRSRGQGSKVLTVQVGG